MSALTQNNAESALKMFAAIVLQMFIAVINEGFDLLEHEKLRAQEDRFAQAREIEEPLLASLLDKINIYKKMKPQPVMSVAHIVPSMAVNSSRQAIVEEYLQGKADVSFPAGTCVHHWDIVTKKSPRSIARPA